MALISEITSPTWDISLKDNGKIVQRIENINQSIGVILTTQKGSCPLNPEFGSDIFESVDKPLDLAKLGVVKSSIDALKTWEKRINLNRVVVVLLNSSNLVTRIFWSELDSDILFESTLNVPI